MSTTSKPPRGLRSNPVRRLVSNKLDEVKVEMALNRALKKAGVAVQRQARKVTPFIPEKPTPSGMSIEEYLLDRMTRRLKKENA